VKFLWILLFLTGCAVAVNFTPELDAEKNCPANCKKGGKP
jgi:hypothetical protein